MIKFQDAVSVGDTRTTQDGYLVAVSRIARTGVQDYHSSELGIEGDRMVRVMRPKDEVFARDAMTSLANAPVTVNHPDEPVDAKNWRDLAVGEVGQGVMRDGEWLVSELIVKDAAGIQAARETHQEISMGYMAKIEDAPANEPYDFVMKDIRFNHLAFVRQGRAGSQARIGDGAHNWGATPVIQDNEVKMDVKTIVVGDAAVQVAASDAHTIERVVKDHKAEAEALKAEIADRDTTIGELKAENAETAKAVLSDADIAAEVVKRKSVTDKAAGFIDGFVDKGQSIADIKRASVKAHFGDEAASAEVADAEINGIFRVMKPTKVDDSARDILKDGAKRAPESGVEDVLKKYMKKEDK